MTDMIIEARGVTNILGNALVHDRLDFDVKRGEIIGIVGGSGSGKTTLMRALLMLLRPSEGEIRIFGTDILSCSEDEAKRIRHRWGVMFQHGALFSSLTVLENVFFPLREFTELSKSLCIEMAMVKLDLVGLDLKDIHKYPSQLSGGMKKRVALARAIALDPELLFLDEPTAGLDPKSAKNLDDLVIHLRNTLGLTIVIITHELNTLWRTTDRVAFLGEGKVLAQSPIAKLEQNPHPLIQAYFADVKGIAQEEA